MAKKDETLLQEKVLKYFKTLQLSGHPIFYDRRVAGGLSYEEGVPDIYCVYNGVHIEIELKVVGGAVRARQEAFERKCRNWGILYIRPDTYKEVVEYFEKRIIPLLGGGDQK